MRQQEEKLMFCRHLKRVFIIAAVVYLLTALYMNLAGGIHKSGSLPGTGGSIGPVTVTEADTVLEVDIHQRLNKSGAWAFVTAELLDDQEQYLTGFGDELYYETGYDSDGKWTEVEADIDNKLTILEPGDYYFEFTVESNLPEEQLPGMRVDVTSKHGSSVPHFIGGLLLLMFGLLLHQFGGAFCHSS